MAQHSEACLGDVVEAVGTQASLPVLDAESIQLIDPLEQPVPSVRAAFRIPGSDTQILRMGRDRANDDPPLDAREFRRMAIRLSVLDGVLALALRDPAGNVSEEDLAA